MAGNLQTAIRSLVLSLTGPTPRSSDLIAKTGLDKSIVSRIVRGSRSDDSLEALHRFPGPQGLSMLVDVAEAEAPATEVAAARSAIDEYSEIISGFADGAAGLRAAIAGWVPEAMRNGLRQARQAVYRSMSYVLGFQAAATLHTKIHIPIDSGSEHRDTAYVVGHYGLRRLRSGTPIVISGHETMGGSTETLEGHTVGEANADPLLRDHCTQPTPELEFISGPNTQHLLLPSGSPPVGEEVQLVTGLVDRSQLVDDFLSVAPRIPSKVFCSDLYIRDDDESRATPPCTWIRLGSSVLPNDIYLRHWQQHLDELDLTYDVVTREAGETLSNPDIPGYTRLMQSAFSKLGEDPARYRLHRVRWEYPISGAQVSRLHNPPSDLPR